MTHKIKKIVLAYSGGLDTSVIIKWLKERYDCKVIAFTADIGQGDEIEPLREKAIATGADKVYIKDLKGEFARDFIFPILRANAIYEGGYLLGTSIARPLIAKEQIKVAEMEGAEAVSHGATGKGNDQVRFELTYYGFRPDIKVIAPWREWDLRSRNALIEYAQRYGIPVPVTKERPYSSDRNLFHISFEGGLLEDPWVEPPEDMFVLTVSPEDAPDRPTYIEIGYEGGDPVSIDGERLSPEGIISRLNKIGGDNGIGRIDMVENRLVGIKSRGVYETPGGTILHIAHHAVESITMDREVMHIRDSLIPQYATLIYNGFWYSPERELLQKTIDESQRDISGNVRLKLYKGNCIVVGRRSDKSLYKKELATFEEDDIYDPKAANGFIRLNALRINGRMKR
ncbi:MAG: argininosuccinate synthase [Nitrospinae bacterium]|nr:argininosuccinate synthase [Nitrospinota bacterium]